MDHLSPEKLRNRGSPADRISGSTSDVEIATAVRAAVVDLDDRAVLKADEKEGTERESRVPGSELTFIERFTAGSCSPVWTSAIPASDLCFSISWGLSLIHI